MTTHLPADPRQWVRDLEAIWQARDGVRAAEGFTDDAVQIWGVDQRQSGPELLTRPAQWFAYASDLEITKTYIAHSDNRIVAQWSSRYTRPEDGVVMHERGIEYFCFRDGLVCEQHAWQHTWRDGEAKPDSAISTE
jgi:SnoaL-like domain